MDMLMEHGNSTCTHGHATRQFDYHGNSPKLEDIFAIDHVQIDTEKKKETGKLSMTPTRDDECMYTCNGTYVCTYVCIL